MNIEDFFKDIKASKIDELFTIPKGDKSDDIPHFKKNIFEPHLLHQCDILFLPTSQFGFKYCLVCVDVYNSKIDAVALKEKTSKAIVKGLETIYIKHNILEFPLIIQFDSGKEFKNSDVKAFMKKHKVDVKYTLTNRHRQNAVVENANKRLGTIILKFQAVKELQTKKSVKAWHMYLDDFVKFLNDKVKVDLNTYDPYKDVAGNDSKIDILSVGDRVRHVLDYPVSIHNNKRIDSKFRVGDMRWSKDTFKIMKVILNPDTPPLYMINEKGDENKINNDVAYTKNQLILVQKVGIEDNFVFA